MTDTPEVKYGWFSPSVARHGYSMWTTLESNFPVQVTYVTNRMENPYAKKDPEAYCVGALRKLVRRVEGADFHEKNNLIINRRSNLRWGAFSSHLNDKTSGEPFTMEDIVYGSKRSLKKKSRNKNKNPHY